MRTQSSRPLPVALALLRSLLPTAERDEVVFDLETELAERRVAQGRIRAALWLWRQVIVSLPVLLGRAVWRGGTGFEPPSSRYRPGGSWIEGRVIDLRYAARHLWHRPFYAILAIVTLSLGAGGAAAVSSLVHSFLLSPLPYPAEDELVSFWSPYDWSEAEHTMLRPDYPGFASVAAHSDEPMPLRTDAGPARLLDGVVASSELFATLGREPLFGRTFESGDDLPGAEPVAVLGHGLWRSLGGDPGIVGSSLALGGGDVRVVGIMPPDFWFPRATVDVWVTASLDPENFSGNYALVGRLEPGRQIEAMDAPLQQIAGVLRERIPYPPEWDKTRDPFLVPLRQQLLGAARTPLLATHAAMFAILLMAAANVAALMLGHLGGRSEELAVRAALGAPKRRLAAQLLSEALLLGLGAGLVASGVAAGTFAFLRLTLPLGPLTATLHLDWTVVGGAVVLGIVTAAFVSMVPIFDLLGGDLRDSLQHGRRGSVGVRGGRVEAALVIGEIALAVLLAVGTALLVRSVQNLGSIDPGLDAAGVAVVEITMPAGISHRQRLDLVHDLSHRLAMLPGARSAGAVQHLPLQRGSWSTGFEIEGEPLPDQATTYFRMVTPDYFETLGLRMLAGRRLTVADAASEQVRVVVNQTLVQRFFGDRDPLGRRISHGMGDGWAEIVGVVEDEAVAGLTDALAPTRYMLYDHVGFTPTIHGLVVAGEPDHDASVLASAAAREIHESAPDVAVARATTMERLRRESMGATPRVLRLVGLLAGLALALGAIGVYGTVAHFVGRRASEWSVRLALGQRPAQVVSLVLWRSGRLVLAGLALGLLASGLLGRLLASLLYGVEPADPWVLGVAGLSLIVVGILAALLPAWRAGTSDPATLLRRG